MDKENVRMEMQLSEEWIKDFAVACGMLDGPVAMSDCLTFANGLLARAQADAQPVAWQVHPFDYGIGSEGVYARTDRPEQVEAWKRKGWEVQALFTRPTEVAAAVCVKCGDAILAHDPGTCGSCHAMGTEASAPGLSEEDLRYVQRVLESDAPPEDRQRARDLIVKTRLTRASAATVAEPSDTAVGTFSCPICGHDTPHAHNNYEVVKWLRAQADRFLPDSEQFIVIREGDEQDHDKRKIRDLKQKVEFLEDSLKDAGRAPTEAAQQQAEPESVIKRQAQKIGELIADRDSWIEAHARLYRLYHDQSPRAGEEIHVNVEGGDVYTLPLQLSGMDKPRFVVHVPCSPQAEPVGDALEFRVRDAIQGIANCIADPMWTGHAEVSKANLKRWHKALHDLLAAQSGQRAGAAKGWKLVPVEPTDEMVRAGNDLPRYATPARHVWEAMLAAAPTQQQEGQ